MSGKLAGKVAEHLFNTPTPLWDSEFSACTAVDVMRNYIEQRCADPEMRRLGVGLYFRGPAGLGKTTSAIQLVKRVYEAGFYEDEPLPTTDEEFDRRMRMTLLELNKEATERMRKQGPRFGWDQGAEDPTIYFTRAAELRSAIRYSHTFRGRPISDVVKIARVMIVDDLTEGDFKDEYFNWLSMVVDRSNRGLTTFFTSIRSFEDLEKVQPLWASQVGNILYEVELTGVNRRQNLINRVSDALHKTRAQKSSDENSKPT